MTSSNNFPCLATAAVAAALLVVSTPRAEAVDTLSGVIQRGDWQAVLVEAQLRMHGDPGSRETRCAPLYVGLAVKGMGRFGEWTHVIREELMVASAAGQPEFEAFRLACDLVAGPAEHLLTWPAELYPWVSAWAEAATVLAGLGYPDAAARVAFAAIGQSSRPTRRNVNRAIGLFSAASAPTRHVIVDRLSDLVQSSESGGGCDPRASVQSGLTDIARSGRLWNAPLYAPLVVAVAVVPGRSTATIAADLAAFPLPEDERRQAWRRVAEQRTTAADVFGALVELSRSARTDELEELWKAAECRVPVSEGQVLRYLRFAQIWHRSTSGEPANGSTTDTATTYAARLARADAQLMGTEKAAAAASYRQLLEEAVSPPERFCAWRGLAQTDAPAAHELANRIVSEVPTELCATTARILAAVALADSDYASAAALIGQLAERPTCDKRTAAASEGLVAGLYLLAGNKDGSAGALRRAVFTGVGPVGLRQVAAWVAGDALSPNESPDMGPILAAQTQARLRAAISRRPLGQDLGSLVCSLLPDMPNPQLAAEAWVIGAGAGSERARDARDGGLQLVTQALLDYVRNRAGTDAVAAALAALPLVLRTSDAAICWGVIEPAAEALLDQAKRAGTTPQDMARTLRPLGERIRSLKLHDAAADRLRQLVADGWPGIEW